MSESASTFIAKSTIKSADLDHRRKINFNIGKYNAAVPAGKQQFPDLHSARERQKILNGVQLKRWMHNWKVLKQLLQNVAAK